MAWTSVTPTWMQATNIRNPKGHVSEKEDPHNTYYRYCFSTFSVMWGCWTNQVLSLGLLFLYLKMRRSTNISLAKNFCIFWLTTKPTKIRSITNYYFDYIFVYDFTWQHAWQHDCHHTAHLPMIINIEYLTRVFATNDLLSSNIFFEHFPYNSCPDVLYLYTCCVAMRWWTSG